jgi:protein regulator of cytokinesis 1
MDTPVEEQQLFQHVTCHIASTEDEVSTPGILSMETIAQVLSYFDLNVQGLF